MKFKFDIVGLDCPNCAAKLAALMEKREGIASAKINFLAERLTVESDLSESELIALLSEEAKRFSRGIEIKK